MNTLTLCAAAASQSANVTLTLQHFCSDHTDCQHKMHKQNVTPEDRNATTIRLGAEVSAPSHMEPGDNVHNK